MERAGDSLDGGILQHGLFLILGTASVQLSERKSGPLFPKRHQIKHLEFVLS